jgi:hypothetical protein
MKRTFKKNKNKEIKTLKRKRRDRKGGFLSKLAEKVGLRTIRNQNTGYDGFTLDGPNTLDKVEEDFVAPAATSEISDDERVSSLISNLTPDMTLDERLHGTIDTLRTIEDDKIFVKVLNSLPPNVITKLPMDIIGRRGRLGGGGKFRRRKSTKRRRTLKRRGGRR